MNTPTRSPPLLFPLLQFVNSYASLFYIAFVQPFTSGCSYDSCLDSLCESLAIIFCTRLVIANTVEIYLPRFLMKRKLEKVRCAEKIRRMRERERGFGNKSKKNATSTTKRYIINYFPHV